MGQVFAALVIEAAAGFAIFGAITAWTRKYLTRTAAPAAAQD